MIDAQHPLWGEAAIPGQLALELDDGGGRPAGPTRQPPTVAAGWVQRAATGALIVSLCDPTAGRHGAARCYALGVQHRLDGGADVICAWGRLGHRSSRPHQQAHPYPSWNIARAALQEHVTRRARLRLPADIDVLAKLDQFRGDALFTTWARRFAALEVPGEIRHRLGYARETPTEPDQWPPELAAEDDLERRVSVSINRWLALKQPAQLRLAALQARDTGRYEATGG